MLFSLHLTTFKLYCSGILTSCFCFYSDFNTYWTTRNFDRNQSSFKFLWLSQEIKCYAAKVFLNRELISKTRTFYWGIVYHNLASFFCPILWCSPFHQFTLLMLYRVNYWEAFPTFIILSQYWLDLTFTL